MKYYDDLDRLWPMEALLELIGFNKRIEGRVHNFLFSQALYRLSLRQLMDQFLPLTGGDGPIVKQSQFGYLLFRYALATLATVGAGSAFEGEWTTRLLTRNINRGELVRFAKKRGALLPRNQGPEAGRSSSRFPAVRGDIGVSAFRNISIYFPGDVFLLAAWLVALNRAKSTPTLGIRTTVSSLAHSFATTHGCAQTNRVSASQVLSIFAAHGIDSNAGIQFDADAEGAEIARDFAVDLLHRLIPVSAPSVDEARRLERER